MVDILCSEGFSQAENFTVGKEESALVFTKDCGFKLVIPTQADDEMAHPSTIFTTALASLLIGNGQIHDLILKRMDEMVKEA